MLQNHTILKAKTHQLRYYWYLEKSFFKHRKQSLHKNSRPLLFASFKKKSTPMIPSYANSSSDYLCNRISNSIFLDDTDPEEIFKIISSLNIKKAVGPNEISSKIYKICY